MGKKIPEYLKTSKGKFFEEILRRKYEYMTHKAHVPPTYHSTINNNSNVIALPTTSLPEQWSRAGRSYDLFTQCRSIEEFKKNGDEAFELFKNSHILKIEEKKEHYTNTHYLLYLGHKEVTLFSNTIKVCMFLSLEHNTAKTVYEKGGYKTILVDEWTVRKYTQLQDYIEDFTKIGVGTIDWLPEFVLYRDDILGLTRNKDLKEWYSKEENKIIV